MEIKYEDFEKIVRALDSAYDAMVSADFDFDCEEEQDEFFEQIDEVRETLRFAKSLI